MSQRIPRFLDTEQITEFHRNGYLVVEDVFPEERLEAVADEVTEIIEREASALVAEDKLSSTYAEYPFTSRLSKITEETDAVYRKIANGQLAQPAIFELIRTPELLDVAESLCGPELIASSVYRLRPKIPGFGLGIVPWHQDSGYFEPYCDNSLILTCWVPLVDATPENGCLQVLRYSHLGPVVTHVRASNSPYLVIPDEHLPEGDIVTVPVRRGGVLLLTNRTMHRSTPNNTDIIRWSMDLRYQSSQLPTNAAITRLPEEVESVGDEAPVACYPPEADFLVRSRLRANEILDSAAEFEALRKGHLGTMTTNRWRSAVDVA